MTTTTKGHVLHLEAEIERLKAAELLQAHIIKMQVAEVERLTAVLQWIADRGDVDDLDSLDEIIERARAALEGK